MEKDNKMTKEELYIELKGLEWDLDCMDYNKEGFAWGVKRIEEIQRLLNNQ